MTLIAPQENQGTPTDSWNVQNLFSYLNYWKTSNIILEPKHLNDKRV